MNRGAGRRVTFRNDAERALFVTLLSEIPARYEVEVHAYCLMDNHYHLLVRSRSGRLSESMAWLGSQFTRAVNERRDVDGAIFRGRFHSVAVERDAHLDWLFRYINSNPLDRGWTRPLVEYPWSGLAASLGRVRGAKWLETDYIHDRFGCDFQRLERFVEDARVTKIGIADQPHLDVDVSDIAGAVALARSPGPQVNTDAEVRAACTYIELVTGAPHNEISTVGHLGGKCAAQYHRRVRDRCERQSSTQELVARATSILVHERELALVENHRVSDTG